MAKVTELAGFQAFELRRPDRVATYSYAADQALTAAPVELSVTQLCPFGYLDAASD